MLAKMRVGTKLAAILAVPLVSLGVLTAVAIAGPGTSAAVYLVVAAAGAVVSITIAYVVGRSITRPLRQLTAAADRLAGEQLPALVSQLQSGAVDGAVRPTDLEVSSGAELRRLAHAFNSVQRVTVDVAQQQGALLRKGISDIFVHLARRNQALLDRQIEFIDQLEANERDPDQLANLFRLDHLATRMRRNAESLLVLAGAEPSRRRGRPVALAEVLRVAVGEVADYARITVQELGDVHITAAAAVDTAHLLAELMDNATQYSAPDTPVEVSGRHDLNGAYVLSVVDRGIGFGAEQLRAANAVLSDPPVLGLDLSASLGFVVVGLLSRRHGITVQLHSAPHGGCVASVTLPAAVVDVPAITPGPESLLDRLPAPPPPVAAPAPAASGPEPITTPPITTPPITTPPIAGEPAAVAGATESITDTPIGPGPSADAVVPGGPAVAEPAAPIDVTDEEDGDSALGTVAFPPLQLPPLRSTRHEPLAEQHPEPHVLPQLSLVEPLPDGEPRRDGHRDDLVVVIPPAPTAEEPLGPAGPAIEPSGPPLSLFSTRAMLAAVPPAAPAVAELPTGPAPLDVPPASTVAAPAATPLPSAPAPAPAADVAHPASDPGGMVVGGSPLPTRRPSAGLMARQIPAHTGQEASTALTPADASAVVLRRSPREQLRDMTRGGEPTGDARIVAPQRSPEEVRRMLSRYRSGLQRGRGLGPAGAEEAYDPATPILAALEPGADLRFAAPPPPAPNPPPAGTEDTPVAPAGSGVASSTPQEAP